MLGSSKDLIWDLWEYWGWTVGPSQIRLAPDWINWTNWAPGQSAMARPQPIRFLVNQNQEGPLVNTKWMFIPKNMWGQGHLNKMVTCFRKRRNTMVSEFFELAVLSIANKKIVQLCNTPSTDPDPHLSLHVGLQHSHFFLG